ncbi:MAG: HEAT repeat domain-containing protein [Xanthomonadaceae bacterium]|nr:HEAT repeat domain-containing protein [Xanthomonadaceae bacterium]
MYKLKIVLAITLLTSVGVLIVGSHKTEEPSSHIERDDRTPASRLKCSLHSLEFAPKPGMNYTYSYSRKIDFHGSSIEPVFYHGDLIVSVIKTNDKGFEAIVQNLITENQDHSHISLRVLVSTNGEDITLFQSHSLQPDENQSISILKDMISLLIFSSQEDTTGKYHSEMKLESESSELRNFVKTKLTYIAQNSPTPAILKSKHDLIWDSHLGMPLTLSGDELTQFGNLTIQILASYQINLTHVNQSSNIDPLISSLTENTPLALELDTNEKTDEKLLHTMQQAKAMDWEVITQKLNQIEVLNSQEQLKVFGELVKSLKAGKTRVTGLMDFLKTKNVLKQGEKSAIFKTSTGALASLGTPEAQSALIEIYNDPAVPTSGRGTILSALTTMSSPQTPETQKQLIETVKNESNPNLSLGAAYAVSAFPTAPVVELIRDMKHEQLETAIDMIGNSGSEKFLPDLTKIITGDNPTSVRAKAVFALRSIPGVSAAQFLGQCLSDHDVQVRESAIDVILSTPWTSHYSAAINNCISQETNRYIRSQCIKAHPSS